MSCFKRTTLFILFITLHFSAYNQFEIDGEKVSYRKWCKLLAVQQINHLHKGALLVRLSSRKKSLELYREKGYHELADKYEKRQNKLNKKIVSAFNEDFNFCPVYFFYSHDSRHIKNQHFDSLTFINSAMKPDSSIMFNYSDYLIAEFGKIKQDTVHSFDEYYLYRGEDGIKQRRRYVGRPNMDFGALIIMSDQFIQLRRPFPYYVRNFDSIFLRRSPSTCIKKMNQKLKDFYKRHKY